MDIPLTAQSQKRKDCCHPLRLSSRSGAEKAMPCERDLPPVQGTLSLCSMLMAQQIQQRSHTLSRLSSKEMISRRAPAFSREVEVMILPSYAIGAMRCSVSLSIFFLGRRL